MNTLLSIAIDCLLMVSVAYLYITNGKEKKKVTARCEDLKESLLIIAKNPARARKALREKYGDQEGI